MDLKWNWRWMWGTVAVFITLAAIGWVWNAWLMEDWYAQTETLWRSMDEAQGLIWWHWASLALFSAVFAKVFTMNYEGKGWTEGWRYGMWIALIFGTMKIGSYAWMPVDMQMVWTWVIGFFVQFSVAGIALAWVYKPLEGQTA